MTDKKSYHNRVCKHCEKEEWNADKVEKEAEKFLRLREMLGGTMTATEIMAEAERERRENTQE